MKADVIFTTKIFKLLEERTFREGFQRGYIAQQGLEIPQPESDRIQENLPYNFEDILQDPSILWTKNYVSYGLALNIHTPLGPGGISYGIPWKRCPPGIEVCTERGNTGVNKLTSGVLHLSLGADF